MARATPGCGSATSPRWNSTASALFAPAYGSIMWRSLTARSGQVKERFLRNLEAFLLSAARHRIHVNFTFCAFDPQTIMRHPGEESFFTGPGTNPYTDPVAIRAAAELHALHRAALPGRAAPELGPDQRAEFFQSASTCGGATRPTTIRPSLPRGAPGCARNTGTLDALARAWNVTPEELGSFESLPLPEPG